MENDRQNLLTLPEEDIDMRFEPLITSPIDTIGEENILTVPVDVIGEEHESTQLECDREAAVNTYIRE